VVHSGQDDCQRRASDSAVAVLPRDSSETEHVFKGWRAKVLCPCWFHVTFFDIAGFVKAPHGVWARVLFTDNFIQALPDRIFIPAMLS
jgi:hypothetical protein